MSRRTKQSNKLPWILLGIIGLAFVVYQIGKNIGSGDACGDRGVDEEKKGYCLTTSNDYDSLVIVVGNTQNSPIPELDFNKGELKKLLSGVFYKTEPGENPNITIISAARGNETIEFAKEKTAKNISASNNNLKRMGRSINGAIKKQPSHGGVDYFNAILEASHYMRNANSSSRKAIIVIGSGYNDTGVLDFAHDDVLGKYNSNKEWLDYYLNQDNRVKEGALSGISIYWYNLGKTVFPQREMKDYYNATEEIYTRALTYAGANISSNSFIKIEHKEESIKTALDVEEVYLDDLRPGDDYFINDTVSIFKDNQDILENPNDVKKYLSSFVQLFKKTQYKLSVTGYMDNCLPGNNLGLRRANVIKSLLIEMGVPEDRIEVHGEFGPPPKDYDKPYVCEDDSSIPNEEQRTVRLVVK